MGVTPMRRGLSAASTKKISAYGPARVAVPVPASCICAADAAHTAAPCRAMEPAPVKVMAALLPSSETSPGRTADRWPATLSVTAAGTHAAGACVLASPAPRERR